MNERYHFYRCTDPKNAPPYAFYDYSNGLVGYPNKLAQTVSNYAGAYYLGFKKEKELDGRSKLGVRPSRIVKTHYHND